MLPSVPSFCSPKTQPSSSPRSFVSIPSCRSLTCYHVRCLRWLYFSDSSSLRSGADENVDITISVIKVLEEMTDEDVGEANDGQQTEETAEAFDTAFSKFLTNLLSTPILELLLANIGRLNPAEPTEQQGLYHTFSLIENLLSSPQAALTAKNLISTNFLTEQVFKRLPQVPAAGNDADEQNRYYAAELLAVLLSIQEVSKESRDAFMAQDGLDCCLKVLSLYRKKEPRGEEIEFFENVFDAVCAVLDSEEGKKAFREAEGIELMLILMK